MRKLDKLWIGLLTGLLVPMIGVYIYYANLNLAETFGYFLKTAVETRHIATILKLSVLGNLIFFLIGLQVNIMKYCRGIILSTFIYAAFIVYYSFI